MIKFKKTAAVIMLAMLVSATAPSAAGDNAATPGNGTAAPAAADPDKIPAEFFVSVLRRPPAEKSWGKLKGTVSHRRRGSSTLEEPIIFSVMFTGAATVAQIFFKGVEKYDISQSYTAPFASSAEPPQNPTLQDFGLRPEDLTMSFIFKKLRTEGERVSVKGQNCRVFLFGNDGDSEYVKVYVSTQYMFPLKVEWFAASAGDKPFRTLEVTNFKKAGGLWVVTGLSLSGPGWRTIVDFSEVSAGLSKDGVPSVLFIK